MLDCNVRPSGDRRLAELRDGDTMRIAILAILLAGLPGAAAQADEVELAPTTLVAIRQAGYALQGANLGDIARAVQAGVTDVKPFKDNAEAIRDWSKVIPALFPKGTETQNDTKALPKVWSDRAGFEKAAAALTAAAETLVKAADANDAAAFVEAFKATADACKGCHKPYRAK